MNQNQAIVEVGKRILPILQEFGIESCMICGYIRIDDKVERFVAMNIMRDDAGQVDGMRQPAAFATIWAAPDQPPTQEPETRTE